MQKSLSGMVHVCRQLSSLELRGKPQAHTSVAFFAPRRAVWERAVPSKILAPKDNRLGAIGDVAGQIQLQLVSFHLSIVACAHI